MPREIADSDDELDCIPPAKLTKTNTIERAATTGETWNEDQLDPVLGTDFDQFLSPTQRLSSYDGNSESPNDISTSRFLDSSTNRFLEAVAPSSHSPSQDRTDKTTASQLASSDMGGKRGKLQAPSTRQDDKKRSRSNMEDGDTVARDEPATKKKARATYGSASTSSMKSKDASEFQTLMHDSRDTVSDGQQYDSASNHAMAYPSEMISVDARSDYTSPLDLSLHLSPTNGAPMIGDDSQTTGHTASARGYTPHQSYQPRDYFYGANLRGVTTSNSSMGNYQSFSINPEKLGMDFDKINPFGSLSQVSLPGDLDSEETRGIANIFRNGGSYSTKVSSANDTDSSHNIAPAIEDDMQTSPIKGENEFNLRSRDRHVGKDAAQCSPPFSQITNPEEQLTGEANGTSGRPRGEKLVATDDAPVKKPAPKKRGRKPKNQKTTNASEIDPNDIDELHTYDPPIDRRTRAGTIDSVSNMSEVSQATNSSQKGKKRKTKKTDMAPPDLQSKKLPSSDLGLDNKAIIGLSPERYVPRPSRRRGQVEPQNLDQSDSDNTIADAQDDDTVELPTKPSPAQGKKGKKGKKKGAKATEAALAKQQEDFDTKDTRIDAEEVVPEDELPNDITSEILYSHEQGLSRNGDSAGGQEDEDKDEEVTRGGQRRTKISVDIPVLAKPDDNEDLPPPVAEPKKRGRKRKKPLEEAIIQPSTDAKTRTALSEKDANIQIEKSAPDKAFLEDEEQQENQDTEPIEQEQPEEEEEQTPASRSKSKTLTTTATPSKPYNAPTSTSSGLKPLSSAPLFNARARIGLSKRHSIPSLLRKVDRNKEAPKNIERKEKVTKRVLEEREQERIAREEAEAEGREYKPLDQLRDKDGRLVEWDF